MRFYAGKIIPSKVEQSPPESSDFPEKHGWLDCPDCLYNEVLTKVCNSI